MSEKLICNVCEKNESVGVACSGLGAVSFAYCKDCLTAGREPYGMWVAQMMDYDDFHPDYRRGLDATLALVGKSVEQFNADAREAHEEYASYVGEWLATDDDLEFQS